MDPLESECERLLRDGDPEAIPRMMKRYNRPLFSFLYHLVGDRSAAEDLLQEVFVRVWKSRERYEAKGRLASWLFTISRNLAVDYSEKARRRRAEPLERENEEGSFGERFADPGPTPEREAENTALRGRVETAIAELPKEQREVFLMREYGGLSFAEISKAAKIPLGTALARMRYAVLKLRKSLGDVYA